ncbi:hypothetical protein GLOIN_2v1764533 [Rhizophagus clarus]|uniref:Uncharacterized protein n=1 Tax=Rhizophagus clarus TaxID=94130 RepID=A0A8H3QIJ2_9GLOM|nr:hypothetical protein GLOIN_2v1764533 [Rhizophagus clarus]
MSTLLNFGLNEFDDDEFDELLEFDPFIPDIETIIPKTLNPEIMDQNDEIDIFTRDTKIKDVRHSLVPIEYLVTSEEGIAYAFHIQYTFSEHGGGSSSQRGGVKSCQLANPDFLKELITDESNPFICENGSSNTPTDRLVRVLSTYSNGILSCSKYSLFYPNNTFTCGGKVKINRYLVYATNQWKEFIGYDKWKQNEKGHMSLQIKEGVDVNLLKSLFASEGRIANQEDDTNCNKLYPSSSHQKYCWKQFVNVFGTNMLVEIHSSLNNIDKLQYLIAHIQKTQHPHSQGILG